MVRRYDEPIEVRQTSVRETDVRQTDVRQTREVAPAGHETAAAPAAAPSPDAFVWRGRLYVVRTVLDRWKERRPWWRDVHDQHDQAPDQHDQHQHDQHDRRPEGGDVLTEAREQLVWRVEASAGRLASVGVFDLGLTPEHQWTLLRVAD